MARTIARYVEDGWVRAGETWTYASATTFTISGDKTGKYGKGDKIKLTQTTVKYFYIVAVAYSAGTTTVTITGGNDYTLANASITSPYFSKVSGPQGFPEWFSYTPTWTGFSAAPGDLVFKISGRTCIVYFPTALGTSNAATFKATLPVASSTEGGALVVPVPVHDNGAWPSAMGVAGLNLVTTEVWFGINATTIAGNAFAGFTGSGNKGVTGYITYQI